MIVEEWQVAKAKSGDNEAFETIYSTIYKDLYRYAYYMLRDREDALDAVSDTVCDVYRSLSSLKEDGAFVGWVLKILSVKCRAKRKEYIDRTVEYDETFKEGSSNIEESEPASVSNIDAAYKKVDIENAMQYISDEEREIVILSAIYGYNSKEIGERFALGASTVRSKLNRALSKIKKRMVAYDE